MNSSYEIKCINNPLPNKPINFQLDLDHSLNLLKMLKTGERIEKTHPFLEIFSKRGIENALALDLSKNNSGIQLYIQGYLYSFNLKMIVEKNEDFEVFALKHVFKQFLFLFKDLEYDIIAIEENVLGSNNAIDFVTLRKLIMINYVVDELIQEGVLRTKVFDRIPVVSWKSDLNKLANNVGDYLSSKGKVLTCLEHLGYPLALEYKDKTNKEKTSIGFEDRLDACGLLISSVLRYNNEVQPKKNLNSKAKKIRYDLDIYSEYSDVFEYHDVSNLKTITYNGIHLDTKIKKELNNLLTKVEDKKDAHFILKTKSLGDIGIEKGINELDYEQFYIYVRMV